MKTAAIIPAYNEEDRIGDTLAALKKVSGIDRIIVVRRRLLASDSGSSQSGPALRLYPSEKNPGQRAGAGGRHLCSPPDGCFASSSTHDLGASARGSCRNSCILLKKAGQT